MAQLGIMIEGQEDLTWERFFRLADSVESLGFESLFRSDHLVSLEADPRRQVLPLWPSLTALALRTRRIRFGPLVCSMTFRHPALLASMAASVDQLSGGRLELGLGAGWYQGEHQMFGVPYPKYGIRLDRLEEGLQLINAMWRPGPATFSGQHFSLAAADSYPRPVQTHLPLIIGGKGEKRTLRIVAQYATEWNCTYVGVDAFIAKARVLDAHCDAVSRDPASLRRSLMTPFVIGRDFASVQRGIQAHQAMFPSLPGDFDTWRTAGFIGGSPQQVVDQLAAFHNAGVSRFLLQHNDLDNLAPLELLAADVLPFVSVL